MSLALPRRDFAPELVAHGDLVLAELGPAVSAADPTGSVAPRNRLLCAGLGLLGVAAYRALGGVGREAEVGRAGAMLSLITKIDDQVIDALDFHGGAITDRDELCRRTRAFLAPTLVSIRDARAPNAPPNARNAPPNARNARNAPPNARNAPRAPPDPRCAFAAELGVALRALAADGARLDRVLATIAAGWEVQVEAVRVLTSHPSAVTRAEVAAVTRSISGLWLLMIARLGELPGDASRAFTPAEEEGFLAWGWAIQRADALADLAKDLADGHLSSWPGRLLWERAPEAYLDAAARGDATAIYALLRAHEVERDCLPDAAEAKRLEAALPALGEVPDLLAWIHAYLARRYLGHPLHALTATGPPAMGAPAMGAPAMGAPAMGAPAMGAPAPRSPACARLFPEPAAPRTPPCSAP